MGINSANYLILPKILGGILTIPILVVYAMVLSIIGGALSGMASEIITIDEFVRGLRSDFIPFSVTFSIIKATTFAFLITSISAYHGYRTEGGALEVGQSSTKAVVYSAVAVIIFDYVLSDILLS